MKGFVKSKKTQILCLKIEMLLKVSLAVKVKTFQKQLEMYLDQIFMVMLNKEVDLIVKEEKLNYQRVLDSTQADTICQTFQMSLN